MKTFIFLDTNILDKQFFMNPVVEELFRFRGISGNDVEIILPEIVLQELVDHARIEVIEKNESIKSINNLRHWARVSPIKEFEVEEITSKYEEQLFKSYPFRIFTPDADVYKKVFDRYFQKLKPFENKRQQFKDGLLWETILNFKEKFANEADQYFLITKNSTDFAMDKQNKDDLHPDYKAEFPELVLKNDINSFLDGKGYYDDYLIDDFKEEKMLCKLEEYFLEHRWEFEEPLSKYIFEKNVSSKNDFVLNGLNDKDYSIDYSKKPRKSSLYLHVPIIIETTINLLVRKHYDSWEIGEDDEYKQKIIPAQIKCEAVFSEVQDEYHVVIMDKILISDDDGRQIMN